MIEKRDCRETVSMERLYNIRVEEGKHTHTLTHEELAILNAKPTVEPDRSTPVKWRKKRKWKASRSKRDLKPKAPQHPGTYEARQLLKSVHRPLNVCEECGLQDHKMQVHHVDGNPYNNSLENLKVLCRCCHGSYHNVVGMKDVKAWYWGTIPDW